MQKQMPQYPSGLTLRNYFIMQRGWEEGGGERGVQGTRRRAQRSRRVKQKRWAGGNEEGKGMKKHWVKRVGS